jgi:hypothetical protein
MSTVAVDWRDFAPLVRISTSKCPVPVIISKVREAAREFCTKTRIWTQFSETADILAGQAVYGLRPPAEADLCAVLDVRVSGNRLRPLTPAQWRSLPSEKAREPYYFIVTEPSMVHLHPEPNVDIPGAFVAEVALQPSLTSSRGPQFLLARYGSVIARGAQAEILLMPERPWTDAANGAALRNEFRDEMAAAQIGVDRGGADAPLQVKYIPFF